MANQSSKKRIGILTMYYNSANYGGLLQAYALTRYLNDNGYDAKQITYDFSKVTININIPEGNRQNQKVLQLKRKIKKALVEFDNSRHGIRNLRQKRIQACKQFRVGVPHTKEVYSVSTLKKSLQDFDAFITGSDQVWNPNGYRPGFFLTFVNGKEKIKISYAASISSQISTYASSTFKATLKDFHAISVREKSDVETLKTITGRNIQWVLDPVFLLSKEQWNDTVEEIRDLSNIKFLFCYFLGDSVQQRKSAQDFAKVHGLKLVTIPYLQMKFRHCDQEFGDIKLNSISPNQFLWLIQNAEYIFTDSFHATAFSIIFRKKFVVFDRAEHPEMVGRIRSITDLFKCSDLLLSESTTQEEIEKVLDEVQPQYDSDEYNKIYKESMDVLSI